MVEIVLITIGCIGTVAWHAQIVNSLCNTIKKIQRCRSDVSGFLLFLYGLTAQLFNVRQSQVLPPVPPSAMQPIVKKANATTMMNSQKLLDEAAWL